MPDTFSSAGQKVICVTGASGFIGSFLVSAFASSDDVVVRTLRRKASACPLQAGVAFSGDLHDPETLVPFLDGADVVIHLAQPSSGSDANKVNLDIIGFARACRFAKVKRLIYISTATVVGKTSEVRVDEETPCHPANEYERQKYNSELVLRSELGNEVDLGILRPTAVFGPHGKNLRKLASTILGSSQWRRRFFRFLHGQRRMHLVSVDNVVASIMFLARCERPLAGNVFIISDDDNVNNQYQAVDDILGKVACKKFSVNEKSIPVWLLRVLLVVAGRSQSNPELRYDCSKIASWGFLRSANFERSLESFMCWYMESKGGEK
ncbi:NAD-dependent epimerase/dehydratase family protein [Pseudomonas sp. BN415]|uniref:NAD-dependent epimerase/dehydratase family protein n=1 Tax=Pseudomonas sp. BN415 TaxID=2567889 RepID=UPI00245874A6|nr:NAD-dependent epimerase/dehydratase family protein [Pseudomonas sp. BN415]MDH4585289.1 NAD-dependent epimerase/dehydratase family protein [Pseudomonas sp. BN415]